MHELSIAQSIVDIIGQYVPAERNAEVRIVRVRVGAMSGIVPDSLDFCFGAIVSGTSLEQAHLEIDAVPLRLKCGACRRIFHGEALGFLCPECGSAEVQIIAGTELQVAEIELADRQAETTCP